jgi:predicted trehalose synthase
MDSARHPGTAPTELLEALPPALVDWMPRQRWYAAKGSTISALQILTATPVPAPATTHLRVLHLVVRVEVEDGQRVDHQVPVVVRSAPGTGTAPEDDALILELDSSEGTVRIEDAVRSDEGRAALFGLLTSGKDIADPAGTIGTVVFDPHPVPGRATGTIVTSRLLTGEQSNSSMIFERAEAAPVILKLFRVSADGENPDVVLQGSLDRAGCTRVAPLIGHVRGSYTTPSAAPVHADLQFAQEFLPEVEDAWRVALRDATVGTDFTAGARALGEATAEVHRTMAQVLPTLEPDAGPVAAMVTQMLDRLRESAGQVPDLAAREADLAAIIRRAAQVQWPALQRIHGDYHLGQVLSSPTRGWILLDFEGEPLRPLAQRVRPDCPVRDVAGMLRSLDYVGGAVRQETGTDVSDWVADARGAFLAGYTRAAGIDPQDLSFRILLAAFEADKAAYEVRYEISNRPDWVGIPLGALDRITEAGQEGQDSRGAAV